MMFETNDYTFCGIHGSVDGCPGKRRADRLVADIRAYAVKHYDDSFYWSQLVECYEDADILETLDIWDLDPSSATLADFRRAVEPLVDIYDDREADSRNSAF